MNYVDFMEYWFWFSWIAIAFLAYKLFIKNIVYKRIYGDRWQYYHVIDTGESGYELWPEDLSSKVINGLERVYNREKIVGGTLFYTHDNSEPLQVDLDKGKMKYYCNSVEYTTVLHNDIIKQLLRSLVEDKMMMLLVLIFVAVLAVAAMDWFKFNGIEKQLEYFKTVVQSSNFTTGALTNHG